MIPCIRFKGFEDEWKECKFGDSFQCSQGLQIPVEEQLTEQIKNTERFIRIIDVTQQGELPRYVSNPTGKGKVKENDIFFVRYGAVGTIGYGYNGIIANNLFKVKPLFDADNSFLYHQFSGTVFNDRLKEMSASTSMPAVNFGALNNLCLYTTTYNEQNKIGTYFNRLDTFITLQQRKCDSLLKVKKSMLAKMFPQQGCSVPDVRFKGFDDEWDKLKVTELGKIYIGLVTTMTKHYTHEGTLLIRNSDIKDGRFEFGDNTIYLESKFAEKYATRMHQIGDVITVHTGDVGTSAVITENEAKSIGFATIVTRPDTQIMNSNYLCAFLNTDKHKKWAVDISTGDGRTNYNLGDYYKLVVPIPSIREQQSISSFIQKLNTLITLHQQKLEKLKNMKQALLSRMFCTN